MGRIWNAPNSRLGEIMVSKLLQEVHESEEGHASPLAGGLLSIIGLVLLGIGAANGTGWMAVTGGIVASAGAVATIVIHHIKVEYGIYARIEALEAKNK